MRRVTCQNPGTKKSATKSRDSCSPISVNFCQCSVVRDAKNPSVINTRMKTPGVARLSSAQHVSNDLKRTTIQIITDVGTMTRIFTADTTMGAATTMEGQNSPPTQMISPMPMPRAYRNNQPQMILRNPMKTT
jgi:hypothetical protein